MISLAGKGHWLRRVGVSELAPRPQEAGHEAASEEDGR
jgi:hypothetical protein